MDGGRRGTDPRPVTTFGRLIREQREKRGMSLRDVEAAAEKAGYKLSKSRVTQFENEPLPTWPRAEVIKGLAAALVIPERVLTAALVESMGLPMPHMPSPEWLLVISEAEKMPPGRQRRLLRQIDTLFDVNDDAEGP